MDIDKFGEVVDKFLKENATQIILTFPENTLEPEIISNVKMGPVIDMYLLVYGLRKTLNDLFAMKVMDKDKKEACLDGVLELIKADILKGEK